MLLTTYREFLLVTTNSTSEQTTAESFSLAPTEAEFWQAIQHPELLAKEKGERLIEYLKRIFLQFAQIAAPRDVANLLASYARDARYYIERVEAEKLAGLRRVFQEVLGLTFEDERGEHFFRSSLIQTLFYGIFSAWVLWSRRNVLPGKRRFEWRTANWDLKIPVLRKLFSEVAEPGNLDESGLVEILDWAGDTLNRVDRPAFFRTFQETDAVQYFYEPFLEAFDPDLRKQLGVWYTPREIVQYMVARVDRTLREGLGLPDGLADERVVVLDPCCGTGAFLLEVLSRVAQTLREKGEEALLAHEMKRAAMERVFGFELLTAPFVVAHLQIGAFIQQLGGDFAKNERAGIYLTNALTGWEPPSKPKTFLFPEFKEESDAADHVKRDAQILVILGNPPYNGFAGIAIGEERRLTTAYRDPIDPKLARPQGQGLNELYVRFYRMAERRIVDQTHKGLVCFISNYSWLDGLSHPVMRERFLSEFDEITVDCLNGDKFRTGKLIPEGKPDPSVFSTESNREGIQPGTAIALLTRTQPHHALATVRFRDLWGTAKRTELAMEAQTGNIAHYQTITPKLELGLIFRPTNTRADYTSWPLLPELFPVSFPGIKTSRDSVVVDIDRDRLEARIKMYFDPNVSFEQLDKVLLEATRNASRFEAQSIRKYLVARGYQEQNVVRYLYRPFDSRWLYWEQETKLLGEKRSDSRTHHVQGNLWIAACQQNRKEYSAPLISRTPASLHIIERGANLFPVLLCNANRTLYENEQGTTPNVAPELAEYLQRIGLEAHDAFYHTVAVLHSPSYANENAEALRQNWPRIPLPAIADLLSASAELGHQITDLLDPDCPVNGVTSAIRPELRALAVISTTAKSGQLNPDQDLEITAKWGHYGKDNAIMPAKGKAITREYSPQELKAFEFSPEALALLGERTVDVYLNDVAYWRNIPERVWDYTIGGYQVLKKWLSYRESKILQRPLRLEEAKLFTEIARRIAAVLLLSPSLDANYEAVRTNTAQV